ncbi:hypothetical protein [Spongiibacter sp.]|uniref:hypothetical protein n=1 Tax=Spongiibacter sp. TaxID=2024860 RepID=UPI0035633C04
MATVFVIQNQHGHFLGKQQQWVDGRDRRQLYRSVHHDEVVNAIFELSSKDIWLRASALECELDNSNQPQVEAGPAILSETDTVNDDPITPSDDTADSRPEQGC